MSLLRIIWKLSRNFFDTSIGMTWLALSEGMFPGGDEVEDAAHGGLGEQRLLVEVHDPVLVRDSNEVPYEGS